MSKPIHILHILQRMEAGGTQALLMNIYRKIDREKIQFDFLVEYPEKQFYDDEIRRLGGKVYYSTVRKDFNILKFTCYLKKILTTSYNYRIVHVHTYSIGYFCLKVAKQSGVPVRIAHSHNNGTVHDIKYLPKLALQKMYTIHATDFFACSEEAGKYLFKNRYFDILQNAIDAEKFVANERVRNDVRQGLGLGNKFVVGHVGRLHPQKNHAFLVEVYEKIKSRNPDSVLLLIGKGPLEGKIKQMVTDKNLSDSVYFLGNRKDMDRIYQAMDVFVFPSLFEGLGIVAIEAQAAGVPVVCSEGLPPEVDITPLCRRLNLSDGAEKWADETIEMSDNEFGHTNTQKYIVDAGFEMSTTAKKMEEYYLSKWSTAKR